MTLCLGHKISQGYQSSVLQHRGINPQYYDIVVVCPLVGVSLISQFCRIDIRYNLLYLNVDIQTRNQPSFWHLFWQRVPFCLVVKSIACSFLFQRTFDCCAMSRACARASGTGCIQTVTNKLSMQADLPSNMSQNRFVSQQYAAIHVNDR